MTPLRQQMIAAMRQRGFSDRTHKSYLAAVSRLARYYGRSPAELTVDELQAWFNHLAQERELSGASCRLYLNGVRFLYLQVLQWSSFDVSLVVPTCAQRIPEILTRAEVQRIFAACTNPKHRMLLEITYGCGLRVSEVVVLRVRDVDGERRRLRIEQGKGAKDRLVILAPDLLDGLRRYWTRCRPADWLFPRAYDVDAQLSISTAQRVFARAKARSGVKRTVSIIPARWSSTWHATRIASPSPTPVCSRSMTGRSPCASRITVTATDPSG